MRFQHGGLALDVPDNWADQSTLLFVGPPEDGPQLPTMASSGRSGEAVQVSFYLAQGDGPREFLTHQMAQVTEIDPEVSVLEGGPFECGLGQGWQIVQRAQLDGFVVRQLVACVFRDQAAIVASAVASEGRFPLVRDRLQEILQSLGPSDPIQDRSS